MEFKKFLLSLVFVFSAVQSAPLNSLGPLPPDDQIAHAAASGASQLFEVTQTTQKIVLNFLRLAPAATSHYILEPLWQGAKAHPFLAVGLGCTFGYLLYKRHQAAQLAARITRLRGQAQIDMTIDNNALPNMADQLKSSWYLNPQTLIIVGLILGCLSLIPEQ